MYSAWIKPLVTASLGLIYPRACTCCSNVLSPDEQQICESCKQSLFHLKQPICQICGSPVKKDNPGCVRCHNCPHDSIQFERSRALLDYNDSNVRQMIHTFKFEYFHGMAEDLSQFLVEGFNQYFQDENIDFIVPVPLHKRRQRHREFNQSYLLAKHLSDEIHIPINDDLVIRNRWTKPQTQLTRNERQSNIRGAFSVIDPDTVQNQTILIIDDVVTTGSTVNELSAVLKQNGAARILVLSLARAYTQNTM